MIYLKLLIGIALPLLLGIFSLAAILKEKLSYFAPLERFALSFALGTWLLTLIMFGLPFINVPLVFINIIITSFILLIILFPLCSKYLCYFFIKIPPWHRNPLIYLLIALISLKILFVFWSSLIKPPLAPDIIMYYALVAKYTFVKGFPVYLHWEPPLPMLIESYLPIVLGSWNDTFLPLFFSIMYICLAIIFYYSLKRSSAGLYALFFTFLLCSIPLLLLHAGTAYSDFPIAFYYSAATIYLFQFFKDLRSDPNRGYSYLLTSMILLGITLWIKKSGLYYAAINLSVLAFFVALNWKNVHKKKLVRAVMFLVLVALPWLAYSRLLILSRSIAEAIPSLQETIVSPTLMSQDKNRIVIFSMLHNMFLEANWQLLWVLFLSTLICYGKKLFRSPLSYLLLIILLNFGALYALLRFTSQFQSIANNSLFNRFLLHFVPVALYFCAESALSPDKGR